MSSVLAFPTARVNDRSGPSVAVLATRLSRIERTDSNDEQIMDLLVDAERAALEALAAAPALDFADVALKLGSFLRRMESDDCHCVSDDDMTLLLATLADVTRLAAVPVAIQA